MGNFGKNVQNPHDNLILKFRQKLLKCTKPTKKVWVQLEFILFFCLQQDMSFTHSQTAAVCTGSHSTVMLFYSYIHAEQIFTTKSVTIFYIVDLCFSAFDVYYN